MHIDCCRERSQIWVAKDSALFTHASRNGEALHLLSVQESATALMLSACIWCAVRFMIHHPVKKTLVTNGSN